MWTMESCVAPQNLHVGMAEHGALQMKSGSSCFQVFCSRHGAAVTNRKKRMKLTGLGGRGNLRRGSLKPTPGYTWTPECCRNH